MGSTERFIQSVQNRRTGILNTFLLNVMRSYLKLKCSVCERMKDELVDTRSIKFPKCSITLGCSGILRPVQYTDNPDVIADAPPTGVQNWYSRFKKITQPTFTEDQHFPITFGDSAEVIFAIKNQQFSSLDDSFTLKVYFSSPSVETKTFREYIFNTTNQIDRLLGVESGVGKKVLRFSSKSNTPEEISVFRNGEKLFEGVNPENFQIARSNNSIQENAIIFNTPIRGVNQFKIIVSKPVQLRANEIICDRLSQFDSLDGCWDNTESVMYRNEKFFTFIKNFSGVSISAGQVLKITAVELVNGSSSFGIPLNDCFILLSNGPTQVDRVLTKAVVLGKLPSEDFSLLVSKVDNSVSIGIVESLLSDILPPFVVNAWKKENLLTESVENQITDTLSSKILIGPIK